MKKHQKLTWRQLLAGAGLLLLFAGLTLFLSGPHRNQQKFRQAAQELFRQEMVHNTLNMHYTVAYPGNFGIQDYEAILPGYVPGDKKASLADLK